MLAFFYKENIDPAASVVTLDEDTSKHIVQVLRMKNGGQLQLTDGKGHLLTAVITDDNRKRCQVNVLSGVHHPPPAANISIAISLIKNNSRFEWFLEKATEIGITTIIPLLSQRTEKQQFRFDRMKSVLVSAMLQSQQAWLPQLSLPVSIDKLIASCNDEQKFIAHCIDEEDKVQLVKLQPFKAAVILIGPEGDFTKEEIDLALKNNFRPVAMGNTRLRTETAGVVAATILTQFHH